MDNVLNRVAERKEELKLAVNLATKKDAQEHRQRLAKYKQKLSDYNERRDLAQAMIRKSPEAIRTVLVEHSDLGDLIQIGPEPSISVTAKSIYANITVSPASIVPSHQKVLLKSGKLSSKQMPKSLYYEIYKAYVCGAAIRAAREIFAAVPEYTAVVSVYCKQLNPKSGHLETLPILSVTFVYDTLQQLNIDHVDPSACLDNFIHELNFSRTRGFSPLPKHS
ncbi:MAG: hypothetical protein KIT08_01060 [Anaerolineales bacterium]|nr:MAG: hypothetical protein KIT08_01060 [Anaerolineales bacterium]